MVTTTSKPTSTKAVPLTTAFKPAASCIHNTYDILTNTPFANDHYLFIGGPSPASCFPSGWASTSQYYSPGVCPDGYTQACASLDATGTLTQTQATCCPTGYVCYTSTLFNFPGQACASPIPSISTAEVTFAANLSTTTLTLHPATDVINAYGVSIRYASTDFPSSTKSSLKATTTPKPATSTSLKSSSTTSPPTNTSNPSSGLSTGAKAGIGVGVSIVGVIAILGLAFFLLRRRRRKSASEYEMGREGMYKSVPASSPKEGVHEMYANPTDIHPVELDATPRS